MTTRLPRAAWGSRSRDHGSAELGVFAVNDRQNLIEGNGVARLDGELLNEQGVALVHNILLTAGNDDRLHYLHLFP